VDRRRFVLTSVAGVLAAPLAARAQPGGKIPRIGVVFVSEEASMADPNVSAFRRGLRDLGYVEGQNIAVEYRYAHGRVDRAPALVAELIGFKVELIVAAGPTALAAKKATSTIPIVCVATGDPVRFGLVGSLARPGGNVTGLALIVDTTFVGKWLELLRETAPRISRVRYLHGSSMGLPGPDLAELKSKLEFVEVRELSQIETAFARIARERGGVIVPPTPFFLTHRTRIAELAAQHRVPAIYGFRAFVGFRGADVLWAGPSRCLASGKRLCGQASQRGQAQRPTGGATNQARTAHQPQDRQGARPDDSAVAAAAGGSGD
jgi:putative ABC transport system substrate-binding protein